MELGASLGGSNIACDTIQYDDIVYIYPWPIDKCKKSIVQPLCLTTEAIGDLSALLCIPWKTKIQVPLTEDNVVVCGVLHVPLVTTRIPQLVKPILA